MARSCEVDLQKNGSTIGTRFQINSSMGLSSYSVKDVMVQFYDMYKAATEEEINKAGGIYRSFGSGGFEFIPNTESFNTCLGGAPSYILLNLVTQSTPKISQLFIDGETYDIGGDALTNTKTWNLLSLTDSTVLTEIKNHIATYQADSGVIVHYQDNVYVGPNAAVGSKIYLRCVRPTHKTQSSYTTVTTQALAFTVNSTSFELIENYSTQGNFISAEGGNYTTAFMPTEDWQPATKKYVDENGGGISSTTVTTIVTTTALPSSPDANTLYFITG